jgi:hypothetical protein
MFPGTGTSDIDFNGCEEAAVRSEFVGVDEGTVHAAPPIAARTRLNLKNARI